jgi:hypothetical protein
MKLRSGRSMGGGEEKKYLRDSEEKHHPLWGGEGTTEGITG